jgi:hypothetical protein
MQEVKIAHDWVLENYEKQKFIDAVAKNGATTHLALLRNNISYFSSLDIQMYRARDYCLIPCFLNVHNSLVAISSVFDFTSHKLRSNLWLFEQHTVYAMHDVICIWYWAEHSDHWMGVHI